MPPDLFDHRRTRVARAHDHHLGQAAVYQLRLSEFEQYAAKIKTSLLPHTAKESVHYAYAAHKEYIQYEAHDEDASRNDDGLPRKLHIADAGEYRDGGRGKYLYDFLRARVAPEGLVQTADKKNDELYCRKDDDIIRICGYKIKEHLRIHVEFKAHKI
jgi:hypothetical protein